MPQGTVPTFTRSISMSILERFPARTLAGGIGSFFSTVDQHCHGETVARVSRLTEISA
jgi:hypothetical protein